jgi:cysteine desulfurase
MSRLIYLDHNASTPLAPEVIEVMTEAFVDAYGNPGSRHAAGRIARRILEKARETVASVLHCQPREVVFTSGGTEATNLALLGLSAGRTGVVVLPPGEHPATEQTVRDLVSRGWTRWTAPIDGNGLLRADALDGAPWDQVRLATAIVAHNETGVIQEMGVLDDHCRQRDIPLHLDAVQAAGKIEVDFTASGASTMSIGAHKFRGPRGIGALLIREGVRLVPVEFGGHQESGRRPGTECTALADGMAKALELWQRDRVLGMVKIQQLRDRLQHRLASACAPVVIHGQDVRRLPNTLNIAFPGCDGDAILVALDLEGIAASLGSACASGSSEPAPILTAMGCGPDVYKSSVRLSVGWTTTEEEVDEAAECIIGVVSRLRAK